MSGASTSSPVLAEGSIYHAGGDGRWLLMIQPGPAKYVLLGRASLPMSRCITPAIMQGCLYVRLQNGVACYDLTSTPATAPATQPSSRPNIR